ncbi:MAG: phage portal protein [Planctomycetes bacterium]|nr:phage portal protein [Planctomycetota bacterium]
MFLRKWLERRATLRDPPVWLANALTTGATSTVSGVTVSPDSALTLSSYYAAIRAISEDVGKLPLILYRHLQSRGRERAVDHPLYRLLHDSPNRDMSAMTFRETLTMHAIGWGNGYAEIVRDKKSGRVAAVWPLNPTQVTVDRNDRNELIYKVRPTIGDEIVLGADQVLHIHGLGFDGLTGYSVAHLARESIGAALAAQASGAALFGSGTRPGGILEIPGRVSDKTLTNLRASWEVMHRGVTNSHKTAILEQGMTYKSISLPHKDAQWIESREFSVAELSRWLRIPPHKIGHLRDATFSNIESQNREYVVDTLQPWLVRWEQEIARKLIPPRSRLSVEHLVEGLLRGDTATRYEAYGKAIRDGWMSRNEVRERENLNPQPGLDTFLEPLNTGPVGSTT